MNIENVRVGLQQFSDGWQAVFACQLCLRPFSELLAMRWGFNAQALLGEAADRHKNFIESLYNHNTAQEDSPEQRSLALRAIRIPETGLLLALVGKVRAPTATEAQQRAIEFCYELVATVPTDYRLYPAESGELFDQLTGKTLLAQCQQPAHLAQIMRFEAPVRTSKNRLFVVGLWQAAERSDEQIWRTLGTFPHPVMFNVALRPTFVSHVERMELWNMLHPPQPAEPPKLPYQPLPFEQWTENFISRRLSPWKKFYLLQVHLACPTGLPDSLLRPVGAALTREGPELLSPGFHVEHPADASAAGEWANHLAWLNIEPRPSPAIGMARIRDIADLAETQVALRLPYPPEPGLPSIHFIEKL